ncbi:MAG: HlyD family efflux transporter periplasmic adaptor subunit [Acidobacteria bacterium]|nr:MAG: HlyD family efflux transporter periplasmic adaptor subunit [Acidobacteriota bacterium]
MDVKREGVVEAKRRKRILYGALGAVALALLTYWLWQLEPRPPSVSRSSVYLGTVERGEMLRQVRGPGTLVPEELRWISSRTSGRVERRVVLPGAEVEPDTVILELSNPELEQETEDAQLRLRQAEANFNVRKTDFERELLNEEAEFARIEAEFRSAVLQKQADEELLREGLVPQIQAERSRLSADQLEKRFALAKDRLDFAHRALETKLSAERAQLDQARALYQLRRSQLEGLDVRAGMNGVLQEVPVEEGQQVTPGTNLARVAQPDKLKAELRIAETQAKDVTVGQPAKIDTRNGVIDGRVIRIDPAVQNGSVTVDVALIGELPRGARPDLSVDGTIELERLTDVLHVGRPAYGQANSLISLYRLDDDNTATRVRVQLGRTSVTTVEIVEGLQQGDRVILSDTSQWEESEKIRLEG